MRKNLVRNLSLAVMLLISFSGFSQTPNNKVIRLYDGAAPGSENWNWEEKDMGGSFTINVVNPTLTVFEADKSVATGIGVVVCPGGAYHFLSMKNEGYDVAKWLNAKGITVFVLKYRLRHLLTNNPGEEYAERTKDMAKFMKETEPIVQLQIADAKAAVKYVRAHAAEYGLKTNRIGLMGFSAGGTLTAAVTETYSSPEERPDFSAPIYPMIAFFGDPAVPQDAPPMFIAAASNDDYKFNLHCTKLYEKWINAGKSAELHIYRVGKHGFGMTQQNLPVDTWMNRYYEWLMDLTKTLK
jgi:acetyl esterase/lipase